MAIRLLWQWYETGYTPQWIKGGEFIERHEGRTFLEEIDALNASNQVIYVEDPFGNVEYEKREKLRQEIHKVIDFIHQEQNVFLILTSKKDVFEQFKKDTLSKEKINEMEKELNILKPSYDYSRRKSILDKWATIKNCDWYRDPKLKKYVLTLLKKIKNLPTPLSIHDFVEISTNVNDKNNLKNLIKTYSESSEKVFAKEIIGLYNSGRRDRVLLLCFVLISDNIDLNYVKTKYNQLKEENFEDFSTLLEQEYRLSKELPRSGKSSDSSLTITFSHPSYRAAVPIILDDNGCNVIFCKVLERLSDQKESVNYVIDALLKYFEKIPSDIGNQLIQKIYEVHIKKQLEEYQIRRTKTKTKNYDDKLIVDLYDKYFKVNQFSWLIIKYYNKLNEQNREILFKLLENFDANSSIVEAITHHYKALPTKIQEVLENLSDDNSAINISEAVYGHIDDIPGRQRNEIIIKLFNNKLTKRSTISLIAANYTRLPKKIREIFNQAILLPENFEGFMWAICEYYERLPPEIQKLLLERISDKKLMKMGNNSSIAGDVFSDCFDTLPEDICLKLLELLSHYPGARGGVEYIVFDYHEMIPDSIREKVIVNLIKYNTDSFEFIFETLASYYHELPVSLRDKTLREVLDHTLPGSFYFHMKKNYFADIPDELKTIIQERILKLNLSSE